MPDQPDVRRDEGGIVRFGAGVTRREKTVALDSQPHRIEGGASDDGNLTTGQVRAVDTGVCTDQQRTDWIEGDVMDVLNGFGRSRRGGLVFCDSSAGGDSDGQCPGKTEGGKKAGVCAHSGGVSPWTGPARSDRPQSG
ncbi:hypothetical protein GCM10022200_25800 [Microbacterium awajiense]|uniref:Uncharacterized protein n=1 Tax=Microbacterium awajiense TaxID=415214 RepID=A0ABP7AUG2_9MICO